MNDEMRKITRRVWKTIDKYVEARVPKGILVLNMYWSTYNWIENEMTKIVNGSLKTSMDMALSSSIPFTKEEIFGRGG